MQVAAVSPRAWLLFALALGFFVTTSPAGAVDIIELHQNNYQGVPAGSYPVGTPVTISGVVTVGVGTFTSEYTDVYVQDATAGIMIYRYGTPPYAFELGDSVTIDGEIDHYRGMTEVVMDTYTVHGSGYEVPEPLVVTCDDVEHVFDPVTYMEPNEGRLVRVNNVTWTGAWPSFSGGITLHDDSGTCTLYIDGTTGVQNMTPPTGPFDVIGVIKQYDDFTPPYTTNYELLPRSQDDFTLHPGPQILNGPRETDLQPDHVTIHLETDVPTTALVYYGETLAYELGSVSSGGTATVHDIVLPGLDPATIYHYEVTVDDGYIETTTPDLLFCSASAAECTGEIIAIFNKSVDYSLATYQQALGWQELQNWIITRINAAQYTIDVAIYSFDLPAVGDAMIAAHNRGVQIRFITENRDTYQQEVTRLINNGITVINDAYGANDGNGLMHNKLWVFDAGSPDATDPWVVSGSWNLTNQGTWTDAQNVILVQDQALATVATAEFNEMWGSETAIPDADESRFGDNKTDNTPKLFNVAGREVRLYFAPSDPWGYAIAHEIQESDYSLNFCILSFTRYDISNEMEARYNSVPGYAVRGVFDSAEGGSDDSEYHSMHGEGEYAWDPPADVWLDTETGSLHHKYMILDVNHTGSDPVVVTGSANWSNAAATTNDENVLIVHDPAIANCYLQEFAERYHAAGGSDLLNQRVEDDLAGNLALRVGPNPAAFELRASFSMPSAGPVTCDLYAIDGRLVDRVVDGVLDAGTQVIRWRPDEGQSIPSGIYYLRLATPEGTWNRLVTLIR